MSGLTFDQIRSADVTRLASDLWFQAGGTNYSGVPQSDCFIIQFQGDKWQTTAVTELPQTGYINGVTKLADGRVLVAPGYASSAVYIGTVSGFSISIVNKSTI